MGIFCFLKVFRLHKVEVIQKAYPGNTCYEMQPSKYKVEAARGK
jgi:hypothetical protein